MYNSVPHNRPNVQWGCIVVAILDCFEEYENSRSRAGVIDSSKDPEVVSQDPLKQKKLPFTVAFFVCMAI
ncbi:MAG: hypothetical protein WD555_02510 [Fulvivirga sp.]